MSSALAIDRCRLRDGLPDGPGPSPHFLAHRQRDVLKAVESFRRSRGYPPALREIDEAIGLAGVSSPSSYVSCLQDKEHRSSSEARPRTALVRALSHPAEPGTDETPIGIASLDIVYVPLMGRIAAGNPICTEQSPEEDIFPLPRQLVGGGNLFLLEVSGDSMVNAAITDGDWVVIREQPTAENGEIVAAMIDGDATVKTLTRADDHVWLMPANSAYKPLLGDEVTIIGKAVAVLRRL
jgi:repressor LexA